MTKSAGEFEDHYRIPNCVVLRATEKAVLVDIPDVGEFWIPQSQIDDRSECWKEGDEGELWISQWIAEQKGIA